MKEKLAARVDYRGSRKERRKAETEKGGKLAARADLRDGGGD